MYNLNLKDKFTNGSGDSLDLCTKNLIHLKEFKNINKFSNPLFKEDNSNNITLIDFEVSPGFFYVGDKEFYLFSEKVTDVVKSTNKILKLKSNPNGYSHLGLYGPFNIEDFAGIYSEELLEKNKILKSLYLNENKDYSYDGTEYGYMYNPDIYPLVFRPEVPISICYTYWELEHKWKPKNPLLYFHDFETNSIVLDKSLEDGIYILEYENTTLKTLTGTNFNPLARNISEGFFLINTRLEESVPDYIKVIDNFKINDQVAVISFEVFNFKGNQLKNIDINVNINTDFLTTSGEKPMVYIVDYNEYYTKYKFLNRRSQNTNIVLSSGNTISIPGEQDYFVLKTEGLISDNSLLDFSYLAKIKINENGIGLLYFRLPLLKAKEQKIKLEFSSNGKILNTLDFPNYNKTNSINSIFVNEFFYDYIVEELFEEDNTNFIYLKELIPEEISLYTSRNFIDNAFGNTPLKEIFPSGVEIMGNILKYSFPKFNNENKQVIVKIADKKIDYVKLNGSYVY